MIESIVTRGMYSLNGPSGVILGHFNLGFVDVEIEIDDDIPAAGAGPGTTIPGPRADEKKYLTIRVRIGEKRTERTYLVTKRTAKVMIRIKKIIRRALDVTIRSFRRVTAMVIGRFKR